MNIVVTITTTHDEASKSIASGYVALLNAVLDTVDRMRLLVELNLRHAPDGATYLEALFPKLGNVRDVKFVVPAAAGEESIIAPVGPEWEDATALVVLKIKTTGVERTIHEGYLESVFEGLLESSSTPILGDPRVEKVLILPWHHTWKIVPEH